MTQAELTVQRLLQILSLHPPNWCHRAGTVTLVFLQPRSRWAVNPEPASSTAKPSGLTTHTTRFSCRTRALKPTRFHHFLLKSALRYRRAPFLKGMLACTSLAAHLNSLNKKRNKNENALPSFPGEQIKAQSWRSLLFGKRAARAGRRSAKR